MPRRSLCCPKLHDFNGPTKMFPSWIFSVVGSRTKITLLSTGAAKLTHRIIKITGHRNKIGRENLIVGEFWFVWHVYLKLLLIRQNSLMLLEDARRKSLVFASGRCFQLIAFQPATVSHFAALWPTLANPIDFTLAGYFQNTPISTHWGKTSGFEIVLNGQRMLREIPVEHIGVWESTTRMTLESPLGTGSW